MIYKNTSIKRVIAKVFTDFDLNEGDHRISDLLEWGGEALEKIGAFPYFTYKVTGMDGEPYLNFVNYQAKLPSDMHKVLSVGYSTGTSGPTYPMRYSTGVFGHATQPNSNITSTGFTTLAMDSDVVILAMSLYTDPNTGDPLTYAQALAKINSEPATRSLLSAMLYSTNSTSSQSAAADTTDLTYVIHDGWIKTNVDAGYLTVAYQAIPTDLDGYPLIPDDPGFIEAVYWYIAMKLLYPQWRDGRVRDAVYYDAKSSWQFYCKQAYGNAMMPSIDQLRSIKNSWLRLIPDIHEGDNFFSTLGQQEIVYNNN
jgi:hypothetical protein